VRPSKRRRIKSRDAGQCPAIRLYGQLTADCGAAMVYTHILNHGWRGVDSPLDWLWMPVSNDTCEIRRDDRSASEDGGNPHDRS